MQGHLKKKQNIQVIAKEQTKLFPLLNMMQCQNTHKKGGLVSKAYEKTKIEVFKKKDAIACWYAVAGLF